MSVDVDRPGVTGGGCDRGRPGVSGDVGMRAAVSSSALSTQRNRSRVGPTVSGSAGQASFRTRLSVEKYERDRERGRERWCRRACDGECLLLRAKAKRRSRELAPLTLSPPATVWQDSGEEVVESVYFARGKRGDGKERRVLGELSVNSSLGRNNGERFS